MNIKINELRVGNFLDEEYSGLMEVININSEGIHYLDARKPTFKAIGRYDLGSFKPIPLTEEWLLKFGFKLNKLGNLCKYVETKENGSRFITFKYSKYSSNWYIYLEHNPPCQYVHQLQNLVFALTGEELEVKL